jgi:hypothetical protein
MLRRRRALIADDATQDSAEAGASDHAPGAANVAA